MVSKHKDKKIENNNDDDKTVAMSHVNEGSSTRYCECEEMDCANYVSLSHLRQEADSEAAAATYFETRMG